MEVNYCEDMLFHFLDNDLNLNICKSWVKYLDDKSLLQPYLVEYSRDGEWVKLLLTFYPEIDYRHNNDKLLVSCCKYGHLNLVKWLVTNGANIRVRDYEPFRYACEFGHLETAEYLFNLIDIAEQREECVHAYGNYALGWSASNGHLDIVKWLVNNGANIRANDYQPFRYTCKNGHLETAKYLLNLIDTVEERKLCIHSYNNYALRWSASMGHLEVIKWLVSNGANIKVNDYRLFMFACESGHLETAKYLLSLIDADNEEKELCVHSDDDYALRWSARNGHLDVVKWLIKNGANIRANNYQPFRYACEGGRLEIAEYLFDLINGEDKKKLCVQSCDSYALRFSAKNGHLEVVKWLVSNGADIRVDNYLPLRYACERGHLETAKYLLSLIDTDDEERKLCIHSSDDSALSWSAENGQFEVVKWLVNNGANIRVNNHKPFQYACEEGHLEIAKYLLSLIDTDEERKLCIHSDDNYALKSSADNGHFEVVKWLVNNGTDIRSNDYEAIRSLQEGEIKDYLLDQLSEEEINNLN